MAGFVSFVSSGPGDPELLTLKAVDRLRRADAVLFDDLSSGPILTHAKAGADLIGVGKRAHRASPKQQAVSRLLVDYTQQGGHIVRLKSGDGGLFGRLEEELIALREAGIDYEIIPGVPSAFAAAAAAGIPLTRRLTARRIQFVTGHDASGQLPEDVNLPALADPTATTVVFMGKRTFSQLQKQLQQHGPHGHDEHEQGGQYQKPNGLIAAPKVERDDKKSQTCKQLIGRTKKRPKYQSALAAGSQRPVSLTRCRGGSNHRCNQDAEKSGTVAIGEP